MIYLVFSWEEFGLKSLYGEAMAIFRCTFCQLVLSIKSSTRFSVPQSNFKAKRLPIWWIWWRVHKMCTGVGFGIEILFQLSPTTMPLAIGWMMPQGGFGDFRLFSNSITRIGCLFRCNQKARWKWDFQSQFCLYAEFKTKPTFKFLVCQSPLSPSSVSIQSTKQLRSQMPPDTVN